MSAIGEEWRERSEEQKVGRGTSSLARQHSLRSFAGTTFHSLTTIVDFDTPTEVRALGGLLSYLQSTVFRLEQDQLVSVVSISPSSTAKHLRVTPAALKSLHVFSDERHPLITRGNGGSKEGFSLFSLLNRCHSKVGSKCLRQWMLRPLTSVEQIGEERLGAANPIESTSCEGKRVYWKYDIQRRLASLFANIFLTSKPCPSLLLASLVAPLATGTRQSGVELFVKPEMAQSVAEIRKLLSSVADVPSVLMRMHKCLAKPLDFLALNRSVDVGIQVLAVLHGAAKTVATHNPAHASFLDGVTAPADAGALANVARRIEETVDEELTREQNRVCIKDGFSADLDNAKQVRGVRGEELEIMRNAAL